MKNEIVSQTCDTIANMAQEVANMTEQTFALLQPTETIIDLFPCYVSKRVSINGVNYGLSLKVEMKKI